LGERLLCKQEVIGSIPFTSTTGEPVRRMPRSEKQDIPSGARFRARGRELIEG
jgi:hypothetical protein